MFFPKVSIKRCFVVTITVAILFIFGFTLRERELWRTKPAQISRGSIIKDHLINNLNNLNIQNNNKNNVGNSDITDGNDRQNAEDRKTFSTKPIYYEDIDQTVEYTNPNEVQTRPWYFGNGERYPKRAVRSRKTGKRVARLLPYEDPQSDRISNQLMFMPPNYDQNKDDSKNKVILLYNGLNQWHVKGGRELFVKNKCPVDTCTISGDRSLASSADMLLYKDHYIPPNVPRSMHQIYMTYFLECPYHTQTVSYPDAFNWTSTYRRDSDIVAPYEKWVYYDPRVKQIEQERNFAQNKTKKVAWFVSNCNARNNRLQYAHELQKHIQVDIYGYCGTLMCERSQQEKCFEILDTDYKFYLAFENSNCRDYITEKFFVNALGRNVLPIVMGARPEDYEASAPYKSYIHVDEFESPKELAKYLHMLDSNDELYNSYFKWKGTGEFINTYFWCRVCAMLHDEDSIRGQSKWYKDVNEWWAGEGVCTKSSWRNNNARKNTISND